MPDSDGAEIEDASVSATELMIQPTPTMMPPNATISRGPFLGPSRSTIQPSIGVSQVSRAMKMLNAIWMSAIAQPCALLHRVDEQGPAVLQVGDQDHADDADHQLQPSVASRCRRARC